jgi:hypothetical protein
MKLEAHTEDALLKLAGEKVGRQGQGYMGSAKIAMQLFHAGFARPVKNGERNLCAGTLDGFRYLETKRNGRAH